MLKKIYHLKNHYLQKQEIYLQLELKKKMNAKLTVNNLETNKVDLKGMFNPETIAENQVDLI